MFCLPLLTCSLVILGRPGSGCTTLLKTLANQAQEYHSVCGSVHYDSLSPKEVRESFRGDPEDDVHFPSLTVEDTLRFAAKTRAPQARTGETREGIRCINNRDVDDDLWSQARAKDACWGCCHSRCLRR
ncbi:hypothetical protein BT96DRAFT_660173 [Gymnopus androsaceus JB14]|uniref:ABC transporter domain-containing protein n=1 Tax=Gymnopus androsaceus JB14 TaxID=1447944 RepID=A0A6A4GG04_9AGAR|nr:hypothetical protein BT96DRAFT_660173 [Gymnopus androsaceus JB14]